MNTSTATPSAGCLRWRRRNPGRAWATMATVACVHGHLCAGWMATATAQAVVQDPFELEVRTAAIDDLAPEPTARLAPVTVTQAQVAQMSPAVEAALELRSTTLQQLDAAGAVQTLKVALRLNGERRTLDLYPYSMRSDDFVLLVQDESGDLYEDAPPPITTYRGHVVGDLQSDVAASIIEGKLYATIVTQGDAWAVQPVGGAADGAPDNLHAVYRQADVIPAGGQCGVPDTALPRVDPQGGRHGGAADTQGTGGRTQIAFDTDVEYYQLNGSSITLTVADIEMIMTQVGLVYQAQSNICYVEERIIVRTAGPDPYSLTNSSNLLCQFRNFWNNNITTSRDIAHLMTGKNLDGTTIGVAWVGVVCNESGFSGTIANCSNTANLGYGLSQTRFSANVVARSALTAHELGHNWNSCHCNQNTCTGGNADADCGIMWSASGAQQSTLLFGTRSLGAITTHRNSRTCLSGCSSTVYVDSRNPATGNGTLSFPYRFLSDGLDWVNVGGTVRVFPGVYPNARTIGKFLNIEAINGVVDLGE